MRAAALRSDSGPARLRSVAGVTVPRAGFLARTAGGSLHVLLASGFLVLCLLAIMPARRSMAGAWLRAPGETYAKAALFRSRGDEEFDDAGSRRPLFDPATVESGRYLESGGSLYAEHGVSRDVTIFGSVLLKVADLEAHGREVASDFRGLSTGIPDVHVGARLPLSRGAWAAALEPTVSIPLQAVDRMTESAPRIGNGSASFALSAAVGRSLPVASGYAQAAVGYRARAGRAPDEVYGDAEAGLSPWGPIRFRLRYDRVDARRVETRLVGGAMESPAVEAGARDARRIAPTLAVDIGGGGELSLTWRRTLSGRGALLGSEWEVAYAFQGVVGK